MTGLAVGLLGGYAVLRLLGLGDFQATFVVGFAGGLLNALGFLIAFYGIAVFLVVPARPAAPAQSPPQPGTGGPGT